MVVLPWSNVYNFTMGKQFFLQSHLLNFMLHSYSSNVSCTKIKTVVPHIDFHVCTLTLVTYPQNPHNPQCACCRLLPQDQAAGQVLPPDGGNHGKAGATGGVRGHRVDKPKVLQPRDDGRVLRPQGHVPGTGWKVSNLRFRHSLRLFYWIRQVFRDVMLSSISAWPSDCAVTILEYPGQSLATMSCTQSSCAWTTNVQKFMEKPLCTILTCKQLIFLA